MINAALVEQIAACYGERRHAPAVLARLRDAFPTVRFTLCSDDEVGRARPVLERDGFNLYLVGGDHCLTLTNDLATASGVVLAEVGDDT